MSRAWTALILATLAPLAAAAATTTKSKTTPQPVATETPLPLDTALPIPSLAPTPTPDKTFPGRALEYLPSLVQQINDVWPDLGLRSALAAQVEQETCVSLNGRGCWNPHTELKTSREYGFGLGQITIAYEADGKTERFNNFNEIKKLDAKLSSWKYEDRYNPEMQLRGVVVMDHDSFVKIKFDTANETEKLAFMFSAYNGGLGGVLQDRQLCKPPDCDVTRWFGNVAVNSFKNKIKVKGYSTSFYDTNRCYVRNVLVNRRAKYAPYTQGAADAGTDPNSGSKPFMSGDECSAPLPTPSPASS